MHTIERGILTLMQSAVTGLAAPLPNTFVLEDALQLIRRHGVDALCWKGGILCGLDRNSPAMQTLFQYYCSGMLAGERQLSAIQRIYQAFDAAGIHYLPVKGCNLKALYPEQALRPMGDADILIRMEQYDRIRTIMQQLGFQEAGESDHELIWTSKSLLVELHKRLIPSYNKDYARYYGTGWQLAARNEGTHWYMTDEDTMVYLFTHFAKHYRDAGIGCRQVLDLWLFARTHSNMDKTYIQVQLQKLALDEFYRNMQQMMQVWFAGQASDQRSEFMTQYIMNSGIWGNHGASFLSEQLRKAATTPAVKRTPFVQLRETIFPPLDVMEKHDPFLKRYPWALPFSWMRRGCRLILHCQSGIFQRVKLIFTTSNEAVNIHAQNLDYVGLHFDFSEK